MVVHRIPVEWEEAIGESARRHILDEQTIIADGEAVRAVQSIVRRLTNEIPDTPYRFRITLVGRDMVNAVAFPGGFIVVFTGLLQQAETPEEVAGVLAHEINHVLLRHGLHGTVKNLGLLAAVHIVFGNQDGLVELTQRLGIELTRLTFSRKMETEADLAGLDLLHRANISPSGMIRFFERLAKSERANRVEWLSTHPMSTARVERLESYEANHATSAFTPIQVDWKTVQAEF
jgi:predicted Zn-dependent protease